MRHTTDTKPTANRTHSSGIHVTSLESQPKLSSHIPIRLVEENTHTTRTNRHIIILQHRASKRSQSWVLCRQRGLPNGEVELIITSSRMLSVLRENSAKSTIFHDSPPYLLISFALQLPSGRQPTTINQPAPFSHSLLTRTQLLTLFTAHNDSPRPTTLCQKIQTRHTGPNSLHPWQHPHLPIRSHHHRRSHTRPPPTPQNIYNMLRFETFAACCAHRSTPTCANSRATRTKTPQQTAVCYHRPWFSFQEKRFDSLILQKSPKNTPTPWCAIIFSHRLLAVLRTTDDEGCLYNGERLHTNG